MLLSFALAHLHPRRRRHQHDHETRRGVAEFHFLSRNVGWCTLSATFTALALEAVRYVSSPETDLVDDQPFVVGILRRCKRQKNETSFSRDGGDDPRVGVPTCVLAWACACVRACGRAICTGVPWGVPWGVPTAGAMYDLGRRPFTGTHPNFEIQSVTFLIAS